MCNPPTVVHSWKPLQHSISSLILVTTELALYSRNDAITKLAPWSMCSATTDCMF